MGKDFSFLRKLKVILETIKFSHTIFALPFAFIGAILAKRGIPSWDKILWILIAMVGARSGAMATNRLFDYKFDRENPRTKNWPLVKGEISFIFLIIFTIISYSIFVFSAYMLNKLCFILSFPVIFILSFYSLTKRFTQFSHLFLGFAISLAPVGAWIAIKGEINWQPFLISLAVMFWIAGFDVFYALQDMEFDRKVGLYSIPAKYGVKKSLLISKIFHAIMFICLIYTIPVFKLGVIYTTGVIITGIFLVYEHSLVKENDLSKINKAFFTANGYISITLFIATLIDIIL